MILVSNDNYTSICEYITRLSNNGYSETVCIANVHMVIETRFNRLLKNAISNAKIVTADGLPLTWALRLIHGVKQERVAGMDLLPDLLSLAEINNLGVYFYGGSEELRDKGKEYMLKHYPLLVNVHFESPPFRALTEEEEEVCVERINFSGANIVFVVLGCPKQEIWMSRMKGKINAVMIGIGGALPVLVGMQRRAPIWMQRAGLEWLYRLIQEPRRLFKRYLITNSFFLVLLIRDIFLIRILKLNREAFIGIKQPKFS